MRIIQRHLTQILTDKIRRQGIIAITGPRQAGKTTLIRDLLPQAAGLDRAYITFDDPDERLRFQRNTIPALRQLSGGLILLDEIQKAPYVLDGVKLLFDSGAFNGATVILTGSAQILMLQQVQETLAGRVALFDLLPFSMAEINATVPDQVFLQHLWEQQTFDQNRAADLAFAPLEQIRQKEEIRDALLAWGGFPMVALEPDEDERDSWLRNYRRTYLERDLPDVGGVGDIDTFLRIQQLLAYRTANLVSYSDVARDAGCSPHTVRRYLQTMEITFQASRVRPYHPQSSKRLIKSPKVFLSDTGILRSLAPSGVTPGACYETFIFSELLKWRAHMAQDADILFYRTSAGMEVDFILEHRQGILPIEVKSTQHVRVADARSLVGFVSEMSGRAHLGLLVYQGREVVEITPRVYAVPDWLLLG